MTLLRRAPAWVVCSILLALAPPSMAQAPAPAPPAGQAPRAAGSERLFQGFELDGALVPNQWWEGRLVFSDLGSVDSLVLEGIAAFRLFEDFEVGGRVGFGSTDGPADLPDGSGATDLDLWGKWHIDTGSQDTQVSVGAILTVPTGDDTAGLGFDAFALAFFGALRHSLPSLDFVAHMGLRFNEDGQVFGTPLEAETSGFLGGGVILPLAEDVSVIAEANLESARFTNAETDFSLLGGVDWRASKNGMLRAILAVGLTDGAPDAQIGVGYAWVY